MTSEETPRGLIQGWLKNSEINQSAVRVKTRRSSIQPMSTGALQASTASDDYSEGNQSIVHRTTKSTARVTPMSTRAHGPTSATEDSNTQASPLRSSPRFRNYSPKQKHSTPKRNSPKVSAKVAARKNFFRNKGQERSNVTGKHLQALEEHINDPTPRGLIQAFLNDAEPETPAIHVVDSPATDSFTLPDAITDAGNSSRTHRALSPLVDTEVNVTSANRSITRRKRKRPELSYNDFFQGIEKRMKSVGPRIEEDAATELRNENSTLEEERAETDEILASSPDASAKKSSTVRLQSDTELPEFQISDQEEENIGEAAMDAEYSGERDIDDELPGETVSEQMSEKESNDGSKEPTRKNVSRDIDSDDALKVGLFGTEDYIESGDNEIDAKMKTNVTGQEGYDVGNDRQKALDGNVQHSVIDSGSIFDIDRITLNDADSRYKKLKTPHISPKAREPLDISLKTKKTPVPISRGQQKSHQILNRSVTKTKRSRDTKKSQALLPTSLTKSIFTHFSSAKVSKEAIAAVEIGSVQFFQRLTEDLGEYCRHSHRKTIDTADVELLMKRQKVVTSKRSLHSLIEEHLPMEYRRELIPVAYAGNIVKPKV